MNASRKRNSSSSLWFLAPLTLVLGCAGSAAPPLDAQIVQDTPTSVVDVVTATSDAADAAAPDVRTSDAQTHDVTTTPDAPRTGNALYAHIARTLVRVDPTAGTLSPVGPTGTEYLALAWDSRARVVRVISDSITTPKIGTIDLCTGTITAGPRVRVGTVDLTKAESLAQDPTTGIFYATVDADRSAGNTNLSEATATLDVSTGVATVIGLHDTLQDDGDSLTFIDAELLLLDVAQPTASGVYTIDKANGRASLVATTAGSLLRLAYDDSRALLFVALGAGNATGRRIATMNRTSGAFTNLSFLLPDDMYRGELFTGLLSVPEPTCP